MAKLYRVLQNIYNHEKKSRISRKIHLRDTKISILCPAVLKPILGCFTFCSFPVWKNKEISVVEVRPNFVNDTVDLIPAHDDLHNSFLFLLLTGGWEVYKRVCAPICLYAHKKQLSSSLEKSDTWKILEMFPHFNFFDFYSNQCSMIFKDHSILVQWDFLAYLTWENNDFWLKMRMNIKNDEKNWESQKSHYDVLVTSLWRHKAVFRALFRTAIIFRRYAVL